MIDDILAFVNGNPIKTLDVQITEQTTAIEGSIDGMSSGLQSKIDDMSEYLAEYILENSSEVYSETGIVRSWTVNPSTSVNTYVQERITFKASGNATLTYSLANTGGTTGTFYIYKNSELLRQTAFPTSNTTTSYTLELNSMSIGDVISFKVVSTSPSATNTITIKNINILATPIYARTLNLIEVE